MRQWWKECLGFSQKTLPEHWGFVRLRRQRVADTGVIAILRSYDVTTVPERLGRRRFGLPQEIS